MLVRLSYSGYYPAQYVEVTEEEYQQLRKFEKMKWNYVQSTPKGRAFLQSLLTPEKLRTPPYVHEIIAYE